MVSTWMGDYSSVKMDALLYFTAHRVKYVNKNSLRISALKGYSKMILADRQFYTDDLSLQSIYDSPTTIICKI